MMARSAQVDLDLDLVGAIAQKMLTRRYPEAFDRLCANPISTGDLQVLVCFFPLELDP